LPRDVPRRSAPRRLLTVLHAPARASLGGAGTITFTYATKQMLRARRLDHAEVFGLFSKDEIDRINLVEHIPMLMMDEIRRCMKVGAREHRTRTPRSSCRCASSR
jgi:hypothetical protein